MICLCTTQCILLAQSLSSWCLSLLSGPKMWAVRMSHRPLSWEHFSAWLSFRCYHLTVVWLGRATSVSLGLRVVFFFSTGKRKLNRMFIRTLIWAQVHIFLYICLVMTFHLGVLCLQTNMPPPDSNNKKSTLPRWEPLNHSLSLLLKLFLTPLVAILRWPVHSQPYRMHGGLGEKQL